MRKLVVLVCLLMSVSIITKAIPAHPSPAIIKQPDGSEVTILLHGDEFLSFETTTDGYSVVRNAEGYYVYAGLSEGGLLVPTGLLAHNREERSEQEQNVLAAMPKMQRPVMTPAAIQEKQAEGARRSAARRARYNYADFRGLVILVEYEDCPFSRSDYTEIIGNMINQRDFTGYMTNAMIPEQIHCTGSVRDYFYDNSAGQFDPVFDIIGPVKIPYSQYDAHKTSGAQALVTAAVEAADSLVNFKDFDTNHDGTVDMVYFIFAGGGSNFSGNNQDLIWPHASQFLYTRLDNVTLGRYACSTELYGNPTRRLLDGIGTMCHEFGHVLGQVDEYDTDYDGSGGQSVHPGRWSIMAAGSYLNESRTPCGYSMLERMIVGWAEPTLITQAGDYELLPIEDSNTALRINAKAPDEYFLLENHQKQRWDEYLPGHGLMVYKVDSTDVSVWANNRVNANPAHNYYQLLRASQVLASTGLATDYDGDPFPGSQLVTAIDNNTTPHLKSFSGMPSDLVLSDIAESGSRVTFHVAEVNNPVFIEDFEQMALNTSDVTNAEGTFASWNLTGVRVVEAADSLCTSGNKAAAIYRRGVLQTTAPFGKKIQLLTVNVANPTASSATFRIQYSRNGTSWTRAQGFSSDETGVVTAGEQRRLQFVINQADVWLQITEYTGHQSQPCYLDDVTLICESEDMPSGIQSLPASSGSQSQLVYDLSGMSHGTTVPQRPGIYIVGGRKVVR